MSETQGKIINKAVKFEMLYFGPVPYFREAIWAYLKNVHDEKKIGAKFVK